MTALVGSESSAAALFEVERLVGGTDAATVYQVPVNIIADLIPNTPASSGPSETWLSAENIDSLFASEAEALAGTNNTKLMTPLRVAQAIAAALAE
jgi:hypothetical protein